MKPLGLLKRSLVFFFGLFVMAVGVVLSVDAELGTSPISSPPYVFGVAFSLSLGTTTIIMNLGLILLQILLLRKDFRWIQLIQILAVVVFGAFIDATMGLMSWIQPTNYFVQWAICLLGCATLAFGIFLEVKAKVTYMPGEGLALAIEKVFHWNFGIIKVAFDFSLVTVGGVGSLLLLHRLVGVREGSVAAALLVGTIIRFYGKHLTVVDAFLGNKSAAEGTLPGSAVANQPNHLVITIAREYGSGGHEIGELLAQKLGIGFYDSRLIDLTVEEGRLTPEFVRKNEQKLANKLLFELYEQNYAYISEELPPLDFVLKGHPHCFNLFIHAPQEYRIRRIVGEYGVAPELAEKVLEQKDHERNNYSLHFTHKAIGDVTSYHFAVDSSLLGTEACDNLVIEALGKG